MIRNSVIAVLTLATIGALFLIVLTRRHEFDGGWYWRHQLGPNNEIVLHHRGILFARDEILPGQVPDPGHRAKLEARLRKGREQGTLQSSKTTMNERFMHRGLLGFRWGRGQFRDEFALSTRRHVVRVPLWALSVTLAAYPIIALLRGPVRRHRRWKRGECLACGYNLTGNTSRVCPKCGSPVDSRCPPSEG